MIFLLIIACSVFLILTVSLYHSTANSYVCDAKKKIRPIENMINNDHESLIITGDKQFSPILKEVFVRTKICY